MPKISDKKKEKIQEQIIHYLFGLSPESAFTNQIAIEMARDEEFTKVLLTEMESKNLIMPVVKNPFGKLYQRRRRWRISHMAYEMYSKYQSS